jgi:hypothetical protein
MSAYTCRFDRLAGRETLFHSARQIRQRVREQAQPCPALESLMAHGEKK